jgi:hypothetical protein
MRPHVKLRWETGRPGRGFSTIVVEVHRIQRQLSKYELSPRLSGDASNSLDVTCYPKLDWSILYVIPTV